MIEKRRRSSCVYQLKQQQRYNKAEEVVSLTVWWNVLLARLYELQVEPRGATHGLALAVSNAVGRSYSKKSNLSYSLYYQVSASESSVRISAAVLDISRNKQTD